MFQGEFELSAVGIVLILGLVSPTFWVAYILKKFVNKKQIIRLLNSLYFGISILSILIVVICEINYHFKVSSIIENCQLLFIVWATFLLSRCSEVFYAFLIDAYDKVKPEEKESTKWKKCKPFILLSTTSIYRFIALKINSGKIEMHHRLALAFKSYFELVINFSMLYALIPATEQYWNKDSVPAGVIDSIYFSGVTITTLGYGDISPEHWYPQFLSVYEVLCGFTLIVVCFAVYLSRNKT
jgi:hypothetical protein